MILYNAGGESKSYLDMRIRNKTNILVSYFYVKNNDFEKWFSEHTGKLFLDSGAFTAKEKGVEIDIDAYCDFIKKNKKFLTVYANLDVIGDDKATLKNQNYMEDKGLNPLPTFHQGEDFKYLEYYVDNYDYIALGGLVGISLNRKKLQNWLDKCWAIIFERTVKKGKPLTKIHGFGLTAEWAYKRYPFYSVDSTSWLSYGRYGHSKFENDKFIEKFKVKNVHYMKLIEETLIHYKNEAHEITRLWEHRGINF